MTLVVTNPVLVSPSSCLRFVACCELRASNTVCLLFPHSLSLWIRGFCNCTTQKFQVMCWLCQSSFTNARSVPTRPSRRESWSDTSAPTRASGRTPVRRVGSASLGRSTSAVTLWVCIDPISRLSVRVAGEHSQAACLKGYDALVCVTAALVWPPRMRTRCPLTSVWWNHRQRARRRVIRIMTGPYTWSLGRRTIPLKMMMLRTSRKSTGAWQTEKHLRSSGRRWGGLKVSLWQWLVCSRTLCIYPARDTELVCWFSLNYYSVFY